MNRRTLVIGAALAALSPACGPAVAQGQSRDPREMVARIYELAAGKHGKYDGPSVIDNKEVRERYFSKGLDRAIRTAYANSKKRNEPIIDFDPVLDTQDPEPLKDLQILLEHADAQKGVVAATWKVSDRTVTVRYDLVREQDGWRIVDLRGGQKPDEWSLRKICAQ